jgi:hypothetical protein
MLLFYNHIIPFSNKILPFRDIYLPPKLRLLNSTPYDKWSIILNLMMPGFFEAIRPQGGAARKRRYARIVPLIPACKVGLALRIMR